MSASDREDSAPSAQAVSTAFFPPCALSTLSNTHPLIYLPRRRNMFHDTLITRPREKDGKSDDYTLRAKMAAAFISRYIFFEPETTLQQRIVKILRRTPLDPIVTFAALFLLQRRRLSPPDPTAVCGGFELFVSAFIVASQLVEDRTYSNESFAIVAGLPVTSINQIQNELCFHLHWQLDVDWQELEDFKEKMLVEFE